MAVEEGDIIRTAVEQKFLGDTDIINTFFCRVDTLGTGGDTGCIEAIAEILDTAYSAIEDYFQLATTLEDVKFQNITKAELLGSGTFINYVGGADTGQSMNPQACILTVFPTNLPKVQGRKYFGVMGESINSAGGLVAGTTLAFDSAFEFMIDITAEINGWQFRFGAYRRSDGRFTPFINIRTIPNVRTQRRRTQGFGS